MNPPLFYIFTLQVFPFELQQHIKVQDGRQFIVTALERRVKYFNQFSIQLRNHPVVEIMECCLSDNPLDRPSAKELEVSLDLMAKVRLSLQCKST